MIYYVDMYMGIFKRKMTWISCQAPKLIRLFTQRPVTAGMWRVQGAWAEEYCPQEIHGEKLTEDKGYLSRALCTRPFQHWLPVPSEMNVLFLLVKGEHLSQGKFKDLIWARKRGDQSALPHLLFSIVFCSKSSTCQSGNNLEWRVLNSFNSYMLLLLLLSRFSRVRLCATP